MINSFEEQNKIFNKKFPLELVLNTLDTTVMVLNNEREIVYHNRALLDLLEDEQLELLGMRPGEAFKCIHFLETNQACGTTKFCSLCGALNSIVEGLLDKHNFNECRIITKNDENSNVLKFSVESIPYDIEGDKYVVFILKDMRRGRVLDETFYQLIKNINSGVVIYEAVDEGKDFIVRFVNDAAEKIENINKNDILNKRVTDAFPGIKEFGLLDVFTKVLETGQPQNFPMSFYEDERITGWRENHVFKLPTDEIVAVYEDITEQKQAEEVINETKNWLNLILKTVNTAIVIIDYDTHIIEGR